MPRIQWSRYPERERWALENAPDMTAKALAEAYTERFGDPMTESQASYFARTRGIAKIASPNIARTAGIGTERVTAGGRTYVKVARGRWVQKQNLVWERTRGLKLPEGYVVLFCNGDKTDFSPENLKAARRGYAMQAGMVGYSDRDSLCAALAFAMLKSAMVDAASAPRACRICGRTFTPHRRGIEANRVAITCPECIAAGRGSHGYRDYGYAVCRECGARFHKASASQVTCPSCSEWQRRGPRRNDRN